MRAEILLKLSKGDRAAFKLVFDTYYKSICLFIQKYNVDIQQAEDIAQEVFIKIWEKKILFANDMAFKAYIYQSAKRKALNALAHEDVKNRYQEKMAANRDSENYFFHNYIEQETQRLIFQCLEDLPARGKEILSLNLRGYQNQEIADKLGITISTVKSHKAAAYKFLKENRKDLLLLLLTE